MPPKLLGAHMPASGGLQNAILQGKEIGCDAVQVFTSSPQMWKAAAVTEAKISAFKKAVEETGIKAVVSHDSYLVNLCAVAPEMRIKSFHGLKGEIERCALYGIPLAVSHMGAHMGQGEDAGIDAIAEATTRLLAETPDSVTLCMETTAGQGSCLNHRFEQIAAILDKTKGPARLAVCVDTCHLFAAGYDLRDREGYERTWEAFGASVGFDRLKVIHVNDSKKGLGSRVDRHDHIGEGLIGEECFRLLVNDKRFASIPMILETPMEEEKGHAENLAKLRSLVAG